MKLYYQYWAKSKPNPGEPGTYKYHLLPYHCLDVAAVGSILIEKNPHLLTAMSAELEVPFEELEKIVLFFLAVHDTGKISAAFQGQCPWVRERLAPGSEARNYTERHDSLGMLFWEKKGAAALMDGRFEGKKARAFKKSFKVFAQFSFGHHGMPPVSLRDPFDTHFTDQDTAAGEAFLRDISVLFDFPGKLLCTFDEEKRDVVRRFSWLLAGLFIVCDWIGSNDDFFPMKPGAAPLKEYWARARELARGTLPGTGMIPPGVNREKGLKHLFPKFAAAPTPLQQFCDNTDLAAGPQLWVLEDVTGAGKTEAALILASRLMAAGMGNGFFIGLPTMATSNAMYERMAESYAKLYVEGSLPSLVLSHGSRHLSDKFVKSFRDFSLPGKEDNLLEEDGGVQCARWIADSAKKSMLADVGVGTLDQMLMGVLPARHQSLRLYGMYRKILIVDEVHAYDPYMETLLQKVLEGHSATGGSAILLSATMPRGIRQRLCEAFSRGLGEEQRVRLEEERYPLVTRFSGEVRENHIETREEVKREVGLSFMEDEEEVYALIKETIRRGECLCWIRNTIFDVMNAYEHLKKWPELAEEDLLIFHSRFTLKDRLKKEQEVVSTFGKDSGQAGRTGKILIASQVVEQSLDLDFDRLVSDLAPVDLLLQRAGRLHRHTREYRKTDPVFYLLIPRESVKAEWYAQAFPKACWVYPDTANLWRTKELLKQEGRIKMPGRARFLIERVYGAGKQEVPDVFLDAEGESWSDKAAQKSMGEYNSLQLEKGFCRESGSGWGEEKRVPTRLGDKQVKVYFGVRKGDKIYPMYKERMGWELSSLSLRDGKIKEVYYSRNDLPLIKKLRESEKQFYEWDIILVSREEEEVPAFPGLNNKNNSIEIVYDPRVGLQLTEKEE